jgi:DNA-binding transcriptional MerR regulator
MHFFSIRDIENLTGIKAHTIRIWEQRYQILQPDRKPGNHRQYDQEEFRKILQIALLYQNGHKISVIAKYSPEEINRHILELKNTHRFEVMINQLVEASLDLDEERFETLLDATIEHAGIEKAVIDVVYPFLQKIGLFWMTGNIVPAQEHFTSNLIRRRLVLAIDRLRIPHGRRQETIILFEPTGEFHEIPLLFTYYLLKKKGKRVCYLGVNTDLETVRECVSRTGASDLYLHMITNFTPYDTQQYLENLCTAFPDKKIWLTGSAGLAAGCSAPNLISVSTPELLLNGK